MMEIQEVINEFIKRSIAREKIYSEVGTVTGVDESARTCDVETLGGVKYKVRLQSVVSESKGVVLIPKINSKVVITFLNTITGFVSLYSEIEKIHFEANGEDLKMILNDIIKEVKNAIIQTPAGPGTIAPPTQALLDLIDLRINKIFY